MSIEDVGFGCHICGETPSMCLCIPCFDCAQKWSFDDIGIDGLCPDCREEYNLQPPHPADVRRQDQIHKEGLE